MTARSLLWHRELEAVSLLSLSQSWLKGFLASGFSAFELVGRFFSASILFVHGYTFYSTQFPLVKRFTILGFYHFKMRV